MSEANIYTLFFVFVASALKEIPSDAPVSAPRELGVSVFSSGESLEQDLKREVKVLALEDRRSCRRWRSN